MTPSLAMQALAELQLRTRDGETALRGSQLWDQDLDRLQRFLGGQSLDRQFLRRPDALVDFVREKSSDGFELVDRLGNELTRFDEHAGILRCCWCYIQLRRSPQQASSPRTKMPAARSDHPCAIPQRFLRTSKTWPGSSLRPWTTRRSSAC